MPRITEMFAFIVEDTGPEDEGVIGFRTSTGWVPMVGADMKRVESLRPIARQISMETGKKVKLIHFTNREDLDEIQGRG